MTTSPASEATPLATGLAVLDTNVVLDLLLFADPRVQALRDALTTQRLAWLATEAMLTELSHVLRRPALAVWGHDSAHLLDAALTLCRQVATPAADSLRVPRCTDPDDQIFIDLAWRQPAAWLFSRDRALLRLARAARPHGLWIGLPEHWPLAAPATKKAA